MCHRLCVDKGATVPGEEYPGEPWEHYLVKDWTHGFKCLKCSKVGYVTDIRQRDCNIPRPKEHVPPIPIPPSFDVVHLGASAAVVGEEMAKLGCAERSALEVEVEQLARLEEQLAMEIELQELKEAEEKLEMEELERQLQELELMQVEEMQLDQALQNSAADAAKHDLQEKGERSDLASASPTEVVPKPLAAEPLPVTVAASKPVDGSLRKRLRPLTTLEALPSPLEESESKKMKHDDLPVLTDAAKKSYRAYWTRFVATPQNGSLASVPPSDPSPPLGSWIQN